MSQTINLDVTPGLFQSVLHLHQGDIGRECKINVVSRDGYEIPSGATFKIEGTKPSEMGFTVTGSVSGNVVTFTTTKDMTSESGEIPAQMEISSGDNVIFASNFLLVVEKNVHDETVVDGTIDQFVPEMTLLVERLEAAAATVEDAASLAPRISAAETEIDVLDARIDQIIAPTGEAPSAAEVTDARIGADGVTYSTLGTAIRTQVTDLKSDSIKAGMAVGYGGSVLSDANNAAKNTFYRLFTNEPANYPANMPVTATGYLLTIANKMKENQIWFLVQYFYDENFVLLYTRGKVEIDGSGTWSAWSRYITGEITSGYGLGYAGVALADADNAKPNCVYRIIATIDGYYPANLPEVRTGFLISIGTQSLAISQKFFIQYFTDDYLNVLYLRTRVEIDGSGSWSEWMVQDNNSMLVGAMVGYGGSVLTDANNAKENTIHFINPSDLSKLPQNLPIILPNSYLVTLRSDVKDAPTIKFWTQYIYDQHGNAYYVRRKVQVSGNETYGEWEKIDNASALSKALNEMFVMPAENLVDYNNVEKGYYIDYSTGGKGSLPSWCYAIIPLKAGATYKLITDYVDTLHVAFFSSYDVNSLANYVSGVLTNTGFVAPTNAVYATISCPQENLSTLWCNEADKYVKPTIRPNLLSSNSIRVEKDGSGDFTKLTDALAYGMEHANTTIYLGSGDYDIIEELGADFFANYQYEAYTNMGPIIGNGTHLICSPKSRILCNYTGSNTEVMMGFSPLNPSAVNTKGIGDYIIEGATIIASNVRYCVHDDIGVQVVPYKHEYIRCNMYIDNSNRPSSAGGQSHRCLGGGMGIAGTIIVKECIFDGAGNADNIAVAWHNANYNQQPIGSIVIEGNYFRGRNSIEIMSISEYPEKTPVLISNNSLGSNIVYGTYTAGVDNMEVISWNNEIRA